MCRINFDNVYMSFQTFMLLIHRVFYMNGRICQLRPDWPICPERQILVGCSRVGSLRGFRRHCGVSLLYPGVGLWGSFWGLLHGIPAGPLTPSLLLSHVLGQRLVSPGSSNETSSILVESVTRSSTETCYSAIPKSSSDASKVTSKGAGLSKAFMGQKSSFLVDCSKAGR